MAPVDPASSAFELLVAVVLIVVLELAVAAAAAHPYIPVSFDEPLRTVVAGTFAVVVVGTCPLAVDLVVVAAVGRNSLHRFVAVAVVVAGFRTRIPLVDAVP